MPRQLQDLILKLNRARSEEFLGQKKTRTDYRRKHPTRIIALLCSDGRAQFVLMTKAPMGYMYVERNIGAKFRTGWPTVRGRLNQLMELAWHERRRCLFIATYHFSRSDAHLGCAGNGYDTAAAQAVADRVRGELMLGYRNGIQGNYAITVGIETDTESLSLHGRDGSVFRTVDASASDEATLLREIRALYPDMEEEIARDLVPLLQGNIAHLRELRRNPKPPVKFDHTERVLAVGQGFDEWLDRPNLALIVNDGDPRLDDAVATAASIILKNRDAGRIPDSSALNVISVPYFNEAERAQAELHARYLAELCHETLMERFSGDAAFFQDLVCVMDWETRRLDVIEAP